VINILGENSAGDNFWNKNLQSLATRNFHSFSLLRAAPATVTSARIFQPVAPSGRFALFPATSFLFSSTPSPQPGMLTLPTLAFT
jgi:hypothetical protein